MKPHSNDESGRRDVNFYCQAYYEMLKKGKYKVRCNDRLLFICPFCKESKSREYSYVEFLRHASKIGWRSTSVSLKESAKHVALTWFMERNFDVKNAGLCHSKYVNSDIHDKQTDYYTSDTCHPRKKLKSSGADFIDGKLVWPWMGILANIQKEIRGGKNVGETGSKLRRNLIGNGFNALKVHPLWNIQGFTRFSIVTFNKEWDGLTDALMFDRRFEADHCGKKDWYSGLFKKEKLHGWLAREEEYNSDGLIGEYLRRHGDLKRISDIEEENRRKETALVSNLTTVIEGKTLQFQEVQVKLNDTEVNLTNIIKHKDMMHQQFNDELERMQKINSDQLLKMCNEHAKAELQLAVRREELFQRENDLIKFQALNEIDRRKLQFEKKMNEIASLELKRSDENLSRLGEVHKVEKEKLHRRLIELEKNIDAKQALELQIERLKGAVQVMKHMTDQDDTQDKKMLEKVEEDLKGNVEELEYMESLTQALVVKERKSNDELVDARKALIQVFEGSKSCAICVKRMGGLNKKVFITAVRKGNSCDVTKDKGEILYSYWEKQLLDSSWQPFKVICEKEQHKEVINEDDEKLQELEELGEDAYNMITQALMEMNEYNPSGRYPINELWNEQEGRRASLADGLSHALKIAFPVKKRAQTLRN